MRPNKPSRNELSQLSRDEWEELCSLICTFFFSSQRVEDHFGKGNGLDCFRENDDGIDGWQFRRFNNRLENKQANQIKKNISLAHQKIRSAFDKPLINFTVIFNIDPEPGHKNLKGEIERLNSIKSWAKEEHNIKFAYKGVTWVLTMLMNNPKLMPELFTNIEDAFDDMKKTIRNELFDIKAELNTLIRDDSLKGKFKETINLLLKEANTHFSRGQDLESKEEYRRAITSLEDALRLVEEKNIDYELEGKINLFLAGVEVISGFPKDAINHSKRAIKLLEANDLKGEYLRFAMGNLAFSLYMNQEYEEAKQLFIELMSIYEENGNFIESLRTLTHLLELETQRGNFKSSLIYVERVMSASMNLESLIGPSDLTISSLGSVANFYTEIGVKLQNKDHLNKAVNLYKKIEMNASREKLKRILLVSKSARARCLWNLDKIDEAIILHKEVITEGKDFLPKTSIDAKFNLALIYLEINELSESIKLLKETIEEYNNIGDYPSVEDSKKMLYKIEDRNPH
jgi:tetratricopeptide (TPR) repeat protein